MYRNVDRLGDSRPNKKLKIEVIFDYIKGDNSVENHLFVLKFGTIIAITVCTIFSSLTSIEMLTHLEIITNSEKYCPP